MMMTLISWTAKSKAQFDIYLLMASTFSPNGPLSSTNDCNDITVMSTKMLMMMIILMVMVLMVMLTINKKKKWSRSDRSLCW